MEQQKFEEGKKLFIEGVTALFNLYWPYIKMAQAIDMLDLTDCMGSDHDYIKKYSNAGLWKIGMDTVLQSLKDAKSVEDMKKAMKDGKDFWDLTGIFSNQ